MASAGQSHQAIKPKKRNRRSIATEAAIRDALLAIMRDKQFHQITVTDVCVEADVSRMTFYAHYKNTAAVLDEVLDEMASMMSDDPLSMCAGDGDMGEVDNSGRKPFCELAKDEGRFKAVFSDAAVSKLAITRIVDRMLLDDEVVKRYGTLTPDEVRCLYVFRMNGCLAAVQATVQHGLDWKCSKELIDRFVAAGMRKA